MKVLYQENDWLFVSTSCGKEGFVPYNYCMPLERSIDDFAELLKKNSKEEQIEPEITKASSFILPTHLGDSEKTKTRSVPDIAQNCGVGDDQIIHPKRNTTIQPQDTQEDTNKRRNSGTPQFQTWDALPWEATRYGRRSVRIETTDKNSGTKPRSQSLDRSDTSPTLRHRQISGDDEIRRSQPNATQVDTNQPNRSETPHIQEWDALHRHRRRSSRSHTGNRNTHFDVHTQRSVSLDRNDYIPPNMRHRQRSYRVTHPTETHRISVKQTGETINKADPLYKENEHIYVNDQVTDDNSSKHADTKTCVREDNDMVRSHNANSIQQENDWILVTTASGKKGFVPNNFFLPLEQNEDNSAEHPSNNAKHKRELHQTPGNEMPSFPIPRDDRGSHAKSVPDIAKICDVGDDDVAHSERMGRQQKRMEVADNIPRNTKTAQYKKREKYESDHGRHSMRTIGINNMHSNNRLRSHSLDRNDCVRSNIRYRNESRQTMNQKGMLKVPRNESCDLHYKEETLHGDYSHHIYVNDQVIVNNANIHGEINKPDILPSSMENTSNMPSASASSSLRNMSSSAESVETKFRKTQSSHSVQASVLLSPGATEAKHSRLSGSAASARKYLSSSVESITSKPQRKTGSTRSRYRNLRSSVESLETTHHRTTGSTATRSSHGNLQSSADCQEAIDSKLSTTSASSWRNMSTRSAPAYHRSSSGHGNSETTSHEYGAQSGYTTARVTCDYLKANTHSHPNAALSMQSDNHVTKSQSNAPAKSNKGSCMVLYDFNSLSERDLSVTAGDFVTILNTDDPNRYWVVNSLQKEGFIPASYVSMSEYTRTSLSTSG